MNNNITDNDIRLNIILNSDLPTIYNLYYTDNHFRKLLHDPHTLFLINEKQDDYYFKDVDDLLFLSLYEGMDQKYLETQLLKAVDIIKSRYLNSGDKITYSCIADKFYGGYDYYYYRYDNYICNARNLLIDHGFGDLIFKAHQYNDYKKWLKELQMTIMYYVISKNKSYTIYTGKDLFDTHRYTHEQIKKYDRYDFGY